MALLNNPEACAAILGKFYEERNRMNDAGCDLCGSNDGVDMVHSFSHRYEPPCLCVAHRRSWGLSRKWTGIPLETELMFAKWLVKMIEKERKKRATQ